MTTSEPTSTAAAAPLRWAPLLALALCSCTVFHERAGGGPMSGRATGEKGVLQYNVGRLSFLAPDGWEATGDERRLRISHPEDVARLEVESVEKTFADERACLSDAEEALSRGAGRLTNVRRHPSTFAGRRAVTQEADQGSWHGWAWALCDGAAQYRVFFAGRSPIAPDVLAAWRAFTKSAAITGEGRRS